MKSVLILYYQSQVLPDRNFIIDNAQGQSKVDEYLAERARETQISPIAITDFQYIKHRLSLSIKVNLNQADLEMIDEKDLNYCSIRNGARTNKTYYYFIIDKRWIAQNTIELVLSMDTLNTFRFNIDYKLSPKTLVKRMHKDRFYKGIVAIDMRMYPPTDTIPTQYRDSVFFCYLRFTDSLGVVYTTDRVEFILRTRGTPSSLGLTFYNLNEKDSQYLISHALSTNTMLTSMLIIEPDESYITIHFNNVSTYDLSGVSAKHLMQKIDLKSEDITAPVYKVEEEELLDKDYSLMDWALYYKNKDNQDNSPVECFLVPNNPIKIMAQSNSGELTNVNIPNNKYVIFYSSYPSGALTFELSQGDITLEYNAGRGKDDCVCAAIFNDGGTIRFFIGQFDWHFIGGSSGWWTELPTTFVKVKNAPRYIYGWLRDSLPPRDTNQDRKAILYIYNNPSYATEEIDLGAQTERIVYGKSDIDRSLSENIKLINIPYAPTPFTIDSGVYSFDTMWLYDGAIKQLKLNEFNTRFKNSVKTNAPNPIEIFDLGLQDCDMTDDRFMKDPKLYHSDYHRPKFVYDSFSRIFPLEQIDYHASFEKMSVRGTIVGLTNFSFDFVMSRNIVSKFLFKFDYVYAHSNEDYPNIVAVSRNNEEVLYSSQYLDYIRTGYNYDLKAKERQETASATGLGLSVMGLVATAVIGAATGNPIAIGGAVASGIGLVNSLVNLSKTTAQNEENIQRKLAETQRQAVSVLNADDYDLLYEYSSNKAKLCLYKVSTNMEKVLDDLFYYGGYIVNEQMIPNPYSRCWFNFVQASLVIAESSNLTTEIEEDIKEKFEQGVTFIHERVIEDGEGNPHLTYDINQTHENWEIDLV